ncbi:DNA-binding transcriptional LysR family regulator [Luteibacter jiangsuensis]|uniref:DNA-binding transcriptional LysR family regulator n=1 Tax=Luteibacter jiangsuensis TaxID=637577 RepID=A0ABT9T1I5_9GAMM|nr:LysR family transcriptional regulator [Luteibacter jiangsuensis]MDQ0011134.1 DNA-binding transcriptional LysR family regulator [Luteibacter jiangsuensis]
MRPGLTELEAVLAVARQGSFRAAAASLEMSTSALSQSVASLESRLGTRLFHRTTRSVRLTEAGERFVAEVGPALADIRGAIERISEHGEVPKGSLRINTSVGAARRVMGPYLIPYLRRYPEVRLDLVTEDRLIDIVREGFDAGFRTVDTVPGDMIAVPLGPPVRFAVVGSPDYFARHGRPATPADLARHACIRARMPAGHIYHWEFERHGDASTVDVGGTLTLDEPQLMLEAARAGLGLTYLTEFNVAEDLATGRLERVLEDWTPPFDRLCLYYPGRRHVPAALRALVDLIRETG